MGNCNSTNALNSWALKHNAISALLDEKPPSLVLKMPVDPKARFQTELKFDGEWIASRKLHEQRPEKNFRL